MVSQAAPTANASQPPVPHLLSLLPHTYLCQTDSVRGTPGFIPGRSFNQINWWLMLLMACLFRDMVDFQPFLPYGTSTAWTAVVLNSLQQSSSMAHMRWLKPSGWTSVHPKCKQSPSKRKHNGSHCIDWLDLRKPSLESVLAVLCPT